MRYLSAKSIFILFSFWVVTAGQTLVSTTRCSTATANHSQRKIIRKGKYVDGNIVADTLYIFYQDCRNDSNFIKLVKLFDGTPGTPVELLQGRNPSAAIGQDGEVHLVYESDDSLSRIMYCLLRDPGLSPVCLSINNTDNAMPVIDVDTDKNVHIAWIEKGPIHNRLAYTTLSGIYYLSEADENVTDVSLATTLNFKDNHLCLAYAYDLNNVSNIRFYEGDNLDYISPSWSYQAVGSMPCVSLNVDSDLSWPEPALIYKDENDDVFWLNWGEAIITCDFFYETISFLAIDDIAPPMDFSFIYIQEFSLFHAHVNTYVEPAPISGHYNYYEVNISSPIGTNPLHPSIAYKYFNPDIVDIIWLEQADSNTFNIMHVRRPKIGLHNQVEASPQKRETMLSVFPNPFNPATTISLNLATDETGAIKIFNITGKKVFSREIRGNQSVKWDAQGMPSGIYTLKARIGAKTLKCKLVLQR